MTDMTNATTRFHAADQQRQQQAMLFMGALSEVDYSRMPPSARVRAGDIHTDFLPLPDELGANYRRWRPCRSGTQCLVAAPGGDLRSAVVVALYHSSSLPPPSTDAGADVVQFDDGTVISKTGAAMSIATPCAVTVTTQQNATVNASVSASVTAPTITLDGATTCTKSLTVQGLLTYAAGIAGAAGGAGNTIAGGIKVVAGDVQADGISLKNHHHTEQGDGAATSAAQP